ncbi:MAG: hypothetical protein GF388_11490 [Candidatus Aegiribacteria sp.]|nr:hypothetical protein [Candidatus Aegiribacteria sp.]MBD3295613.1 hypothetical protein [Candidatus Fermentibacteria bacterium]
MKKDNSAVIRRLELALKTVNRIREGFRIEKEDLLPDPSMDDLLQLRERSKSYYRLKLAEVARDVARLKRQIDSDQAGMEEAQDLTRECEAAAKKLKAHLVSTPNRLIRAYGNGGLLTGEDSASGT